MTTNQRHALEEALDRYWVAKDNEVDRIVIVIVIWSAILSVMAFFLLLGIATML